jgi:hypothetical protein
MGTNVASLASSPTGSPTTSQPMVHRAVWAGFTVDYRLANPDFTRLVMTEGPHRGRCLAQSKGD